MIISISGDIGSGKDEVGRIIQEYTSPISGYIKINDKGDATSFKPMRRVSDFSVRKFATKLKQVASIILNVPVEKFEDREFKNEYLSKEWDYFGGEVSKKMTVREFLQKLGTDAVRFGFHEDTWVNALMADYKLSLLFGYPNWIITDTRFPNEAKAIKDKGGVCIKIERPNNPYTVTSHASDTSLRDWNFDYYIKNDSTIENLEKKVIECLQIITPEVKLYL